MQVEYWEDPEDDEEDDVDEDREVETVLATGQVSRASLSELEPYSRYRVRVSVVNSNFTGPHSDDLTFSTAEGGKEKGGGRSEWVDRGTE